MGMLQQLPWRGFFHRFTFRHEARDAVLSLANCYHSICSDCRSNELFGRSQVVPSGAKCRERKPTSRVSLRSGYWWLVGTGERLNRHVRDRLSGIGVPNPAFQWIAYWFVILRTSPMSGMCSSSVLSAQANTKKYQNDSANAAFHGSQSTLTRDGLSKTGDSTQIPKPREDEPNRMFRQSVIVGHLRRATRLDPIRKNALDFAARRAR